MILTQRPIVIVNQNEVVLPREDCFRDITFIKGDPYSIDILKSLGLEKAHGIMILANRKNPKRSDAKSILTALAIERIYPGVHTCVELLDTINKDHFERTNVDEIIAASDIVERMLAQAALFPGSTSFYAELLTYQEDGNEIYIVDLPVFLHGESFAQAYALLIERQIIPIGIRRTSANGLENNINPEKFIQGKYGHMVKR